jgi:phospholipid transport system transporter-binding protein
MFRPGLTLTVNNAKSVLEAGLSAIRSSETQIDFADVTVVDSAAVATMLAWQRAARQNGKSLTFVNIPVNLQSLAQLYGVSDLLNPATPAAPSVDLPHH